MQKVDFLQAIDIISECHSSKIIINHTKDNGQVDIENRRIHIIDCVPAVILKLQAEKFSLRMKDGMMEVSKT